MRKLTIYRRIFYDSRCYKANFKQNSVGIQVHSTGANNPWLHRYVQPDDGRIGKNKYANSHNRGGLSVCASAYIGKQTDGTVAVYQALPWDQRCWLSAGGANGNANNMGYVGFEICEDNKNDKAYFEEAVMRVSVNLTAYLCRLFNTTPNTVVRKFNSKQTAISVMDHHELHDIGCASNHGDIEHWSKKYGIRMKDYRAAVQAAMDEGIEVTYIDCDTGEVTTEVYPGVNGETTTEPEAPAVKPAPVPQEPEKVLYVAEVTCTGSYLNMRARADAGSVRITTMAKGSTCEVLDDSTPWWKVRQGKYTGYAKSVSTDGVVWLRRKEEKPATSEKPADPEPVKTYTVTVSGLTKENAEKIVKTYGGKMAEE